MLIKTEWYKGAIELHAKKKQKKNTLWTKIKRQTLKNKTLDTNERLRAKLAPPQTEDELKEGSAVPAPYATPAVLPCIKHW